MAIPNLRIRYGPIWTRAGAQVGGSRLSHDIDARMHVLPYVQERKATLYDLTGVQTSDGLVFCRRKHKEIPANQSDRPRRTSHRVCLAAEISFKRQLLLRIRVK